MFPQRLFLSVPFGVSLIAIACGGGSSAGGATATSPTPTQTTASISIATAAPALAQEVATAINAALRAGTASSPQNGIIATLWNWVVPALHAQANFTANCSRGGSVSIRYTGFRPVVLAGTVVNFANCTLSVQNRDVRFNADLNSNGYWTATYPGPVSLSGILNVDEIGAQQLTGSVTDTRFGGNIGGLTVGAADSNPPPNPNSCPGSYFYPEYQITPGGGIYTLTLTVGAMCPWTVTATPSFVTVTSGGSGRGDGLVNFSVTANPGASRTGILTVNGADIRITQLAATGTTPPTTAPPTPPPTTTPPTTTPPTTAAGQDAILGEWFGVITMEQPCSQNTRLAHYDWDGTFKRSGTAYALDIYDEFYEDRRTIPMPVLGANRTHIFVSNDPSIGLKLELTAVFAADWKSFEGEVKGSIVCSPVPGAKPQELDGFWSGERLRQ